MHFYSRKLFSTFFTPIILCLISSLSLRAQSCELDAYTISPVSPGLGLDDNVYWSHPRECDPLFYEMAVVDWWDTQEDTVFYPPTSMNRLCVGDRPFGDDGWPMVRGAFVAGANDTIYSSWQYAGFTPWPYVIGSSLHCMNTDIYDLIYPIYPIDGSQGVNTIVQLSFGQWQFDEDALESDCAGINSINFMRFVVPSTGQLTVSATSYQFWSFEESIADVTMGMSIADACMSSTPNCVSGLSNSDTHTFYDLTPGDTLWLGTWIEGFTALDPFDFCSTDKGYEVTVSIPASDEPTECPGDISGDGVVEVNDFLLLNSLMGSSCSGCGADISGDGVVDVIDFLAFNSMFGQACE